MSKIRYSLTYLLALVAASCICLAAVRSGSQTWLRASYTLTLTGLCAAAVASRRRGRSGRFWLGFAVFGWAYFLVALGPHYDHIAPSYFYRPEAVYAYPNPNLLTTPLVDWALARALGADPEDLYHDHFSLNVEPGDLIRRSTIAHLVLAWIVGLGGGVLAMTVVAGEKGRLSEPE